MDYVDTPLFKIIVPFEFSAQFSVKAVEVVVFFYDWVDKEKDRKATYTVLNITEDKIHAEIVKLEYPNKSVREAIYESEIPDFYGDFLSNN